MFSISRKIKEAEKDEFIERILCSVPGMMHCGNIFLAEKAISGMPADSDILEIGSFMGQSALIFHHLMKKHGKKGKIVCVDPYIYAGWNDGQRTNAAYLSSVGNNSAMNREDYMRFAEESFHRNVHFFAPDNTPVLFKMTSAEFFDHLEKGALPEIKELKPGFCFVDGNHDVEHSMLDAKACTERCLAQGFILMDDSEKGGSLGSTITAEEMKRWSSLEFVDANPHLMFRKK